MSKYNDIIHSMFYDYKIERRLKLANDMSYYRLFSRLCIKNSSFLLFLFILYFICPNSYAEEKKALNFQSLGIVTFEDGKKSKYTLQQWDLICTFQGSDTECSLRQLVFKDCLPIPGHDETMVFERSFSTTDKKLTIKQIDIKNGRLDFTINYKDECSECILLFDPNKSDQIKSLNCHMVHKILFENKVQLIEDKLIDKTYYWKPKCGFFMRGANN